MAGSINIRMALQNRAFLNSLRQTKQQTSGFAKFMGQYGAQIGLAFAAAAVAVVKMSWDFERSMTKIETLVGVSRASVSKMRDAVKDMAGEVGKSPQELAEGMFFITSAGLRGADAMQALNFAAKASALGLGEVKDIANATTSIMNAYGSSVYNAERATDLLLKTVKLGKLEASELSSSIGQVIPIAAALGISFEEVGANIATVTRVGLNAAEAITTLKGVMNAFIKPSEDFKQMLIDNGTSIEKMRDKIEKDGLVAAMINLKKITRGNVSEIAKMFPRVQGLTNFLAVMNKQLPTLISNLEDMKTNTHDTAGGMKRLSEDADFLADKMAEGAKGGLMDFHDALEKIHARQLLLKGLGTVLIGGSLSFKSHKLAQPGKEAAAEKINSDANEAGFKFFGEKAGDAFTEGFTRRLGLVLKMEDEAAEAAEAAKKAFDKRAKEIAAKEESRMTGTSGTQGVFGDTGSIFGAGLSANPTMTGGGSLSLMPEKDIEQTFDVIKEKSANFTDFLKKNLEDINLVLGTTQSMFGRLGDIMAQGMANRMEGLKAAQDAELSGAEASGASSDRLIEIEQRHSKERLKLSKEEANRRKAIAIIETTISGAQAIIKTYAAFGFTPVGIAAAAGMGALTAGSIATIAGAKFAKGTTGAPPGMALVGEQGPEMVQFKGGERVISHAQTRNMGSSGDLSLEIDGDKFVIWYKEQARKQNNR